MEISTNSHDSYTCITDRVIEIYNSKIVNYFCVGMCSTEKRIKIFRWMFTLRVKISIFIKLWNVSSFRIVANWSEPFEDVAILLFLNISEKNSHSKIIFNTYVRWFLLNKNQEEISECKWIVLSNPIGAYFASIWFFPVSWKQSNKIIITGIDD